MGSNKQSTITRILWDVLSLLPMEPPGKTASDLLSVGKSEFSWSFDDRTFERYLDTLYKADLAVRYGKATGKRKHADVWLWRSHESRNLEVTRLSMNDALVYQLVKQTAERLLPPDVVEHFLERSTRAGRMLNIKRLVDLKAKWPDRVRLIPDGFALQSPKFDWKILKALQRALLHQRRVRCLYQSAAAKTPKESILEPRSLVQRGATLYIVANQFERDPFTWYCVHRFRQVTVLEQSVRSKSFDVDAFLQRGGSEWGTLGSPMQFKAWVDKTLARTLEESPLAGDMKMSRQDDGAIVTATLHRSWALERWLLGRGPALRVIEPIDLRNDIAKRLREAAAAYG